MQSELLSLFGKLPKALLLASGVLAVGFFAAGGYWVYSDPTPTVPTIALIPQAAGAMRSKVARFGATDAAGDVKCNLYWNAPTSESDAAGQISLIDKVVRNRYQGLVVAPNHSLSVLSSLRRALAEGLPVVVVSAPLAISPSSKLGYVVNDDEKMGELAAREVARLIQGKGSIALLGLTRTGPGISHRVRAAERVFATLFPEIHVVTRRTGAYDTSRAEEVTNGALDSHPDLKAVLSFTATSTRGAHAALKSRSLQAAVHLVGCEQDSDLISYVGAGEIAGVLAENTYRMGFEAVRLIANSWKGEPIPAQLVVPPLLITRQNFNSDEAIPFTRFSRSTQE
jgi:ribose transport system substrate-binding protein